MDELPTAEAASAEAVHKTKNAQQAVEFARETQLREIAAETVKQTKDALLEGLKEVFGDFGDPKDPQQMKVLVQRIPILCTTIIQMHQDISEMKDNQKWAVRIIVGLFIAAVAKVVFIP